MKKILLVICMIACLLGTAACGNTDPTTKDYNGYSYDELKEFSENIFHTFVTIGDEELNTYLAAPDAMIVKLATNWIDIRDEIGEVKEIKEFEVSLSGKNITTVLTVQCKNRDVAFKMSIDETMNFTDLGMEQIYTKAEIMSKAGLNTLMGLGTVFCILIFISLLIACFRVIPYLQKKIEKNKKEEVVVAPHFVEEVTKREEQEMDGLELIAVITAAIVASTGTSEDDFVVRSIKRRR